MASPMRPTTKLIGLIGHPVEHSLSAILHNAAFEETGLDFAYLTFDIHPRNLRDAIRGLAALNIVGVNVTIPHKENVLELLDEVSPEARMIGAANTIVNDGFKLRGENTDAYGFLASLRGYTDAIRGQTVSVLGAGGAARAVLYVLITEFKPRQIHIFNRHVERAEALRLYLHKTLSQSTVTTHELFDTNALDSLSNSRLIVNATPAGMFPNEDESPVVSDKIFKEGQVVMDLVYNPSETRFMKLARASGATTVGGDEMLLQQAAKSFELWTGVAMPLEKVRAVLHRHIQEKSVKG